MRLVIPLLVAGLLLSSVAEAADNGRVVRAYDIADLLDVPRDLPAPQLGVAMLVDPRNPTPSPASPASTVDHLAPDTVLRQVFDAGLAGRIADAGEWRSGSVLVLNAPPVLHDQVERTLAAARDRAQLQVRVNVKLVLMAPHLRLSRFPLVRLDWQPLEDQPGLFFAELEPRDMEYVAGSLRLASRASKELETTHYPHIGVSAGQLGHTATASQLDYKPVSLKQGEVTARVTLGDTVVVRATPSPDRRYLLLEVEHRRCALAERQTMDFGVSGTGEMPLLWQGGERFRRSIPAGYSVVIATGAYLDGKQPRSGFLVISPELRTVAPQVTIQSP